MGEDELQLGLNDSAQGEEWEDNDNGDYAEDAEELQGQGQEGDTEGDAQGQADVSADPSEVTQAAYTPVPLPSLPDMTPEQRAAMDELWATDPTAAAAQMAEFQGRRLLAPVLHAQAQQQLAQMVQTRPGFMRAQGNQLATVAAQMVQVGQVDMNTAVSICAYNEAQRTGRSVLDVFADFAAMDAPQVGRGVSQAQTARTPPRPQMQPAQRAPQAMAGTQTARDPQRRARTPEAIVAERHGLTPAELTLLQSDEILQANRRR